MFQNIEEIVKNVRSGTIHGEDIGNKPEISLIGLPEGVILPETYGENGRIIYNKPEIITSEKTIKEKTETSIESKEGIDRSEFLKKIGLGIVGTAIFGYSCSKNPVGYGYINSKSIIKNGIEYTLWTDKKEYKLGEEVRMGYKVTNKSDKDVTFLILGNMGEEPYTFIVEKNGSIVYYNNHGPINPVVVDFSFTLKPNNYKEFHHNWDMKDMKKNLVEAGDYKVTGSLYSSSLGKHVQVSVPIKISK